VSAYNGDLQEIDRVLNESVDADEVLRQVVAVLHGDYPWVGISFVEEDELVLGPSQGEQTAEPTRIPIAYENNVVAELGVVAEELGSEERIFLERVAQLISPYCLVGWDTGGESWSP
jgi:hypothetical protein